jgi:beta-mannanase
LPSYPSFRAAADGAYDAYYEKTAQALLPYAKQIYAVRIDSELNGSWSAASPFKHWPAVSPKTWIAGFRRLAKVIHATLPNAKIIWNPCVGQSNPFPYYPGDDVVDLLGPDIYCDPRYSNSSHSCWSNFSSGAGGVNLNAFAAFATQHDKPLAIPEWGDQFGDGYMISQMANWMNYNNVVAASYWDSGDAVKNTAALPPQPTDQEAFAAAFGHRPYVGTYWQPLIPVPSVAP